MNAFTYLALGDSYTIGEQVTIAESFPYQAVQQLRRHLLKEGVNTGFTIDREIAAPEIIAKTGWTTDELLAAIGQTVFLASYDVVSLLIGVNNQYRGRLSTEFEPEFENLLKMAITFAGGIAQHVYVLSIPDWGVTPFAKDRDNRAIATEIDQYNAVCKHIAEKHGTVFIDITSGQRQKGNDPLYLAQDGLHPSGLEYQQWAGKLVQQIISGFQK